MGMLDVEVARSEASVRARGLAAEVNRRAEQEARREIDGREVQARKACSK